MSHHSFNQTIVSHDYKIYLFREISNYFTDLIWASRVLKSDSHIVMSGEKDLKEDINLYRLLGHCKLKLSISIPAEK